MVGKRTEFLQQRRDIEPLEETTRSGVRRISPARWRQILRRAWGRADEAGRPGAVVHAEIVGVLRNSLGVVADRPAAGDTRGRGPILVATQLVGRRVPHHDGAVVVVHHVGVRTHSVAALSDTVIFVDHQADRAVARLPQAFRDSRMRLDLQAATGMVLQIPPVHTRHTTGPGSGEIDHGASGPLLHLLQ